MAVTVQGDGGRRYNDGQWHSITATRRGAVGTIIVNNQYRGNSSHIHTDHCVSALMCGCVSVSLFMLVCTCEHVLLQCETGMSVRLCALLCV